MLSSSAQLFSIEKSYTSLTDGVISIFVQDYTGDWTILMREKFHVLFFFSLSKSLNNTELRSETKHKYIQDDERQQELCRQSTVTFIS